MVASRPSSAPTSPVLRALALALLLSVVVVTLYPFGPWIPRAEPMLAYLARGMPRYWTGFDVASNLLAYLLLGALISVAFMRQHRAGASVFLIAVAGLLLSLLLATAQSVLPQRVLSFLVVLANSGGRLLVACPCALTTRDQRASNGVGPT